MDLTQSLGKKEAEILSSFRLGTLLISIEAIEDIHLPEYKGSALRGAFGHALRRTLCPIRGKDCENCVIARKCIYALMFESLPPSNEKFLRNRGSRLAHPYIIRPPLDGRTEYQKGDKFAFEFVLIGSALEYLPYLILTFIHMGRLGIGRGHGQFLVDRISYLSPDNDSKIIYLSSDETLKNEKIEFTGADLFKVPAPSQKATLRFLSRLEIKEKGKYPDINFSILFRRLLTRITTLAYLHCGIDCTEFDFSGLSHAADEVKTVTSNLYWEHATRYSNRQGRRMPFGGWKGEITFEGCISPFWPFLLLGEWVHVGKKASFGLGRYELKW